jgi:hypothetical protein
MAFKWQAISRRPKAVFLGVAVAAVFEVVSALGFGEQFEDTAVEFLEFVDGSFRAVAGQLLNLENANSMGFRSGK